VPNDSHPIKRLKPPLCDYNGGHLPDRLFCRCDALAAKGIVMAPGVKTLVWSAKALKLELAQYEEHS
jgi:hypothetical protein